MSVKEARLIYDSLLEEGKLDTFLPGASGDWEVDKEKFLEMHTLNEEILKNADLNLENLLDDEQ